MEAGRQGTAKDLPPARRDPACHTEAKPERTSYLRGSAPRHDPEFLGNDKLEVERVREAERVGHGYVHDDRAGDSRHVLGWARGRFAAGTERCSREVAEAAVAGLAVPRSRPRRAA